MQIVRRVHEDTADRRADQALVDVRRVRRGQFGGPLRGNRTAGVPEHRHLRVAGDGGRFQRGADRVEGVHPVLRARGEIRSLAFGVGNDHRVSVGEERAEHCRLDIGDDSAEPESTGDRVRRLVIAVERVIGGLVRDHFRRIELDWRLDDRGDVDRRLTGLAGRPVEQLGGLEQRREAEDVIANGACFQRRSRRDAIQGIGVGVEWIILRLRRDHRDAGRLAATRIRMWLRWCGQNVFTSRCCSTIWRDIV